MLVLLLLIDVSFVVKCRELNVFKDREAAVRCAAGVTAGFMIGCDYNASGSTWRGGSSPGKRRQQKLDRCTCVKKGELVDQ